MTRVSFEASGETEGKRRKRMIARRNRCFRDQRVQMDRFFASKDAKRRIDHDKSSKEERRLRAKVKANAHQPIIYLQQRVDGLARSHRSCPPLNDLIQKYSPRKTLARTIPYLYLRRMRDKS
jgi:hypothetical protein